MADDPITLQDVEVINMVLPGKRARQLEARVIKKIKDNHYRNYEMKKNIKKNFFYLFLYFI